MQSSVWEYKEKVAALSSSKIQHKRDKPEEAWKQGVKSTFISVRVYFSKEWRVSGLPEAEDKLWEILRKVSDDIVQVFWEAILGIRES